jgi:hypothetical protein
MVGAGLDELRLHLTESISELFRRSVGAATMNRTPRWVLKCF